MHPRALLSVLCLTLAIALAACGRDADPAAEVPAVANGAPVWRDGGGWRLADTPSVVIGQDEGAREYELAGVPGALRLADGTLVIADHGSDEIRYYSPRGVHLRSVGRHGEGPGEFRWIAWIGQRADSVAVWDSLLRRLTWFAPDGRLARVVRIGTGEESIQRVVGLMGDGSLLLRPWGRENPPAGEHADSATITRYSGVDGRRMGTMGPYFEREVFTTRSRSLTLSQPVIFGRANLLAVGTHGLFTAGTDAFDVTLRGMDGHPVRTFGRVHAPVRATDSDAEAVIKATIEEHGYRGMLDAAQIERAQREQLSHMGHRDTLPAIQRMLVDGEGDVWLEEFRVDSKAAATWSVFDPEGRWLGRVVTPAGVKVLHISGGTVIGVTRNELDVERVVVYPLLR